MNQRPRGVAVLDRQTPLRHPLVRSAGFRPGGSGSGMFMGPRIRQAMKNHGAIHIGMICQTHRGSQTTTGVFFPDNCGGEIPRMLMKSCFVFIF